MDQAAIHQGPDQQADQADADALAGPASQAEDLRCEDVAGVEIDEPGGEFVDQQPAGMDRCHLQQRAERQHQLPGHAPVMGQFADHEEDRQHVDEPQRPERLHKADEVEFDRGQRARLVNEDGAFTANWIVIQST